MAWNFKRIHKIEEDEEKNASFVIKLVKIPVKPLIHLGARVKCFDECRTAVSSIIPLTSLSCLAPLARLNPVPEEVGVITGVERTWAPDIREMSPRGSSPLVTSAGAPRWSRVILRSLSTLDTGRCAPVKQKHPGRFAYLLLFTLTRAA